MTDFRAIFISWEKLRLLYNLVLLVVFLLITVPSYLFYDVVPPQIAVTGLLVQTVFLAVAANLVYFAGPLFDSYLSWLGMQFKYLRHVIFISGLLVSMTIEVAYLSVVLSPC